MDQAATTFEHSTIHAMKNTEIQDFAILTTKQQFNAWIQDGNACKVGEDAYREQSTQYCKVFTLKSLYRYFIKEYIN